MGHVQQQGLDTRQRDGRRVARTGVDLAGTTRQQFACKCQADAAIGTGDESDGFFDFHKRLLEANFKGFKTIGRQVAGYGDSKMAQVVVAWA